MGDGEISGTGVEIAGEVDIRLGLVKGRQGRWPVTELPGHWVAHATSSGDLRESVHVGREANLVLFVVDASGSMAARKRMTIVKTAILSLLRDAYQRRDRIGMITFRGRISLHML